MELGWALILETPVPFPAPNGYIECVHDPRAPCTAPVPSLLSTLPPTMSCCILSVLLASRLLSSPWPRMRRRRRPGPVPPEPPRGDSTSGANCDMRPCKERSKM